MTVYAIHDADGTLISVGTVVADPLPAGLTAATLTAEAAERILRQGWQWDPTVRDVTIAPPSEEIDAPAADPIQAEVAALRAENRALFAALDAAKVIDVDAVKAEAAATKDNDSLTLAVAKVLGVSVDEVAKRRSEPDGEQWFTDIVAKYQLGQDSKALDEIAVTR